VIEIEVDNRSGAQVDETAAVELARSVLGGEGVESGELGLAFVGPEESRALKQEHLGIDEAQNTRPEQMQMFLTRLGFGSKVVVTGDVTQIDLPRDQASGLIQVQEILGSIDGIAFVQFSHKDVVRHKLVQRIVEAYRLHAEETGTERTR